MPPSMQDGAYILGSSGELGRTRSQTRKLSESSDDKKPSVKRSGTMAQTAKVLGGCVGMMGGC